MRIYLAAAYSRRFEMREVARRIEDETEHRIVSGWIWLDAEEHLENIEQAQIAALRDLRDIRRADAVIVFMDAAIESGSGGKYVEMGWALARGTPVIVVGRSSNIFCALPQVMRVADLDEAVRLLAEIECV